MTFSKFKLASRLFVDMNSFTSLLSQDISARIGPNYQVDIPELEYNHDPDYHDESILIWQPNTDRVDDGELDSYLQEVKHKYGFDSLQALSVLFRSNYNIEVAMHEICRIVGYNPS